ncbi:MAG: hypothetical protein IKU70_08555 [Clostridia bacterium]|nr:hypothetical protein [Clostridia bacterium]
MKGYDAEAAKAYILKGLDQKAFRSIADKLPGMIEDFIAYDLHFMKVTGVVDANGEQGDNDYDDDEAFEYIYDAWLSDHPENEDEDMLVAALLNEYMDLQYRFMCEHDLVDM